MRKKLRRIHAFLLVLTAMLGALLGTGVALLALNFTTDMKGISFAGLICLLLTALLCLLLPYFTHVRDALMQRIAMSNSLFGKETEFLEEDLFFKKFKKDNRPVYGLHIKMNNCDELTTKILYFAVANALQEKVARHAEIGYTRTGDFIFLTRDEATLLRALEEADELLRKDETTAPYALLLGVSSLGKTVYERAGEALTAALIDSSIRANLSLLVFKQEEQSHLVPLDLSIEEEMGRLNYGFEEYEHNYEPLFLLDPSLYDPTRGHVNGKDFFHRVDLYRLRFNFDQRCLERCYEKAKENEDAVIAIRLGRESIESAGFLPYFMHKLEEQGLTPERFMFLLPAMHITDSSLRAFAHHTKGLGIHVGLYEYGGEDVSALLKVAPEMSTIKPEMTRPSASRKELDVICDILASTSTKIFIEEGLLGQERSDYKRPVIEVEEVWVEEEEL